MKLLDTAYRLERPDAIIFDWDNTLVDTWFLIHEGLNYTLKEFGLDPWSLEETKARTHGSMSDVGPKYFANHWEEAIQIYRKYYLSMQERVEPFGFSEQTLKLAYEKKIPVCVVSNKQRSLMQNEIDRFGWGKYFKYIVGSGDVESDKPSGMGVELVLSQLNLSPNAKIWFIGDTVTDMETAYNTGCAPVFFGEDDYESDRYEKCRPKVHFANHQLLSEYLKGI